MHGPFQLAIPILLGRMDKSLRECSELEGTVDEGARVNGSGKLQTATRPLDTAYDLQHTKSNPRRASLFSGLAF
jgi:hypothetical protein